MRMEESISEFFNGRSIFITGGTGFMGKVLIEKLARSCPGIKKLYILMRPSKNGKKCFERIKELLEIPVFKRIKEEHPGLVEDMFYPIEGDVMQLDLGISKEDRNLLKNEVSVIFHAAASVRFDDPVKDAIIMNTRGTREVVKLAKELKNLAVFVHVSTTYCNCYRKTVEEIIYPAPMSWREAIYVAENTDDWTMNLLQQKYLGPFPNSYVFTKNLAEKMLEDECENIPTVIYRPSIVIGADREPLPGWIDTFHGPVGLIIGIAKGVIRVAFSRSDTRPDYMPVDISIKGMIVATWKMAVKDYKQKNISIYNSATGYKSIDMKELVDIGMNFTLKYPLLQTLWIPQVMLTDNHTCFYVNIMLKQVLPAAAIDLITKILGKKSLNMMKLQRKIYVASVSLSYFTSKNWCFVNNNFLELLNHIPAKDWEKFNFAFQHIEPAEYLARAISGGHQYLLHTDMNNLPKAVARMKRLYFINNAAKVVFLSALVWFLWTYFTFSEY